MKTNDHLLQFNWKEDKITKKTFAIFIFDNSQRLELNKYLLGYIWEKLDKNANQNLILNWVIYLGSNGSSLWVHLCAS